MELKLLSTTGLGDMLNLPNDSIGGIQKAAWTSSRYPIRRRDSPHARTHGQAGGCGFRDVASRQEQTQILIEDT